MGDRRDDVALRADRHDVALRADRHDVALRADWHDVALRAERPDVALRADWHDVALRADRHDVALRPLGAADCVDVAALIRCAFATVVVDPAPSALRVTAADVAAHLAAGGGVVAGAIVCCLLWAPLDDGLYVSRIAVLPSYRGRGIARAMLASAEQQARRLGLARMSLSTRLSLEGNRRLFAQCGFVETVHRAHPGYDRPTFVEMEKRLN